MEELLELREIDFMFVGTGIGIGCLRIDELEYLEIDELLINKDKDE
jgi:hypothetical protein